MKIVINKCYGGFGLSDEAFEWLIKNKKWKVTGYTKEGQYENPNATIVKSKRDRFFGKYYLTDERKIRTHPDLIECIKVLGKKVNNQVSELHIVEIPDGTEWVIEEYDGIEWIAEQHQIWD